MRHIVFYINKGGGPEAMVENIYKYLNQNEIRVTIITPSLKISKFEVNTQAMFNSVLFKELGLKQYYIIRLFSLFSFTRVFAKKLYLYFRENNLYKLLHGINKKSKIDILEVTEGHSICKLVKKFKIVTRAHGSDWSFRHYCQDTDNYIDRYLIKWQRIQHFKSSANFSISMHTKNHLTEFCDLPLDCIKFVPYPIPLNNFKQDVEPINLNIPSQAKVLLSIGRLEKRKGMDTIVKSLENVWKKHPETYLILLGNESEFTINDLRNLIPVTQQNKIIYPGFINYKLVPSFYKKATIYISASLYETFGYTLLEAQAAGCPIICTAMGAMPELVENGVNGSFFQYDNALELSDKIIELFDNDSLRLEYIQNGFIKSEEYDLKFIGKTMLEEYNKIFNYENS